MQRRFVFLSSSGDLAETRDRFDQEFKKWIRSLGQTEIDPLPYRWEKDEVLRDLDDREPIQGQLERTDGEKVLLTVGLFGERCGVPLADGATLGRDFTVWSNGPFRLLHPWPASIDDSEAALNDGCYPLTGTIFEQLCAIDAAIEDPDRPKPFIGYVADCRVAPDTNVDNVIFNGLLLNDRTLAPETPAKRKELEPAFVRQRRGLLNYLKALQASGKIEAIHFRSAEEMREGLLERTKKMILPLALPPEGSAGYRNALTYYDILDNYPLPGLQAEADQVAETFWDDAFGAGASVAKRTLLLTGPTGCGKSSYMRRGILGSLVRSRKQRAIAIAFRPNDLDPHGGGNCLWLLWRLIFGSDPELKTGFLLDSAQTEASGEAAKALTNALGRIDKKLLLGIDQFEEFLDILFRQSGSESSANRLRPTFKFLRACLEGGRVAIVATLETQRDALREEFASTEFGWWIDETKELHLDERRVRQIVEAPLAAAGLRPTKDALNHIISLWKSLKSGMDSSASALPLLGLWLARLQDVNRELARKPGAGLTNEFQQTDGVLTLDRVKDMPAMEGLIDELATTAWVEVGETYGAVETKDDKKLPNKADLNRFLQPFIGLSRDDQKELRNVARPKVQSLIQLLIQRFLKSRLLVPVLAGQQDMVRLTHQAVIDRWEAGAGWFKDFETYLKDERGLLRKAEFWHDEGRPALDGCNSTEIDKAASALDMLRAVGREGLSPEFTLLRDYSIEVFRHSNTPLALVPYSMVETKHVHVAAQYDLSDLLETWFRAAGGKARDIANEKNALGSGPLMIAAWSSPAAVATLLRHGARVKDPDGRGFHPICSAIQFGQQTILDLLIGHYRMDESVYTHDDRTMLHQAAQSGQLGILRNLIAVGASPDSGDRIGQTPLMYAAQNGHLAIVKELRSPSRVLAKTDEASGGWRAIDLAAIQGKWKVIDLILTTPGLSEEDRASLLGPRGAGQFSPLGLAAASLRPGTVRWFLAHPDIDPTDECHRTDRYGNLAEMTAAQADRDTPRYHQRLRDTLEVLLDDPRIDPTALGPIRKPLHALVAHSGPAGRLVNSHPRCTRDWAALDVKAVRDWIRDAHSDETIRIAQQRPDLLLDQTVLPMVPKKAWPDIAPLLVARTNFRAMEGPRLITALYKSYPFTGDNAPTDAVKSELFRLLIDRIDSKTRAKSGGPVLALIVSNGTEKEVGTLLEKRVPLDRPFGPLGLRPLHLAAERSDKAKFELLSKAIRGKSMPRDDWGRRPSDVAPKPDRAEFVALEEMYLKKES